MHALPPSLKPDPSCPLGLVLSGGGARGAFQVGVWEVLYTHPKGMQTLPDIISGTSAGALNGSFIAAGLSPEEMLEFWLDISRNPPVVGNDTFFTSLLQSIQKLALLEPLRRVDRRKREFRSLLRMLRQHAWYRGGGVLSMFTEFLLTARFDNISQVLKGITSTYLFNTDPVRERLRQAIGGDYIRKTDVKLAINTVDVHSGKVIRLVNAKPSRLHVSSTLNYVEVDRIDVDMILASASIPLLFKPVKVQNMTLWDGGVLVNTPLAPAVALGAERIVPVLVTLLNYPDSTDDKPLPHFGSAIERLVNTFLENAYNVDRKLLLERNELAHHVEDMTVVELFRAIRPQSTELFDAGSYLYFEPDAIQSMYEAGKAAALRWLEGGPLLDRRDIEY